MGIRESLANRPVVGVGVAVILVGIAAIVLARGINGQPRYGEDGLYYYNLETGELFVGAVDALPPIDAPTGGQGVRAYLYSCESCAGSPDEIVYLETYTETARQLAAMRNDEEKQLTPMQISQMQGGIRVAPRPDDGQEPQWVAANTDDGRALVDAPQTLCSGKRGQRCSP